MNDRTNQIIGGVVVIILILGAWYVGDTRLFSDMRDDADSADSTAKDTEDSDSDSAAGNTNSTATTPSTTANGESVTVVDQPAGTKVNIASVTLSQVGWVAVRDSNGRVLGAGRFDTGTSKDVVVELLRGTVAGGKYQVLLYIDDGDKKYDLHKDSLVMNADASVAGAVFTAQ